jgi:hypothetical protein
LVRRERQRPEVEVDGEVHGRWRAAHGREKAR